MVQGASETSGDIEGHEVGHRSRQQVLAVLLKTQAAKKLQSRDMPHNEAQSKGPQSGPNNANIFYV